MAGGMAASVPLDLIWSSLEALPSIGFAWFPSLKWEGEVPNKVLSVGRVSQLWSRICRAAVLAPCMGLSPHQLRWCLPPHVVAGEDAD